MHLPTQNLSETAGVQALSIDLAILAPGKPEQSIRQNRLKLGTSKRVSLFALAALSTLAACLALLSFPSSNVLFSEFDGAEFLSPLASYLQGSNAPVVATNQVRVADQQDPARSENLRLNKDDAQIAVFLSKKYRLAASEVERYVHFAQLAAKEKSLDATLIMAVMSIESNLNSITESPVGAQGLMQVMTSVHLDKLARYGGPARVFDPQSNIMVGATILADCIKLGGSVEIGLKCYVGASGPSDGGYGAKVLAEKERIEKARLGVFDFAANNKVLIDLGILASGSSVSLDTSANNPNDLNSEIRAANSNSNLLPGALASPSLPPSPSGLLPTQPPVTLPAAPNAAANALLNPNQIKQ